MLFKKLKQAWSNWLNRMANQNKAALAAKRSTAAASAAKTGRKIRNKEKRPGRSAPVFAV